MLEVIEEVSFQGTPICSGISIGRLCFMENPAEEVFETLLSLSEVESEVVRYRRALQRSREDLEKLKKQLSSEAIYEGAAILDTHIQIMQDPVLTSTIEYNIRNTQRNAEYVFTRVIQETETKFEAIPDPFFRERSKDVQDVSRRVMGHLKERRSHSLFENLPKNTILLVQELCSSDVAEANPEQIIAFLTQQGGSTSHAAIMSRAKGIPCVANIDYSTLKMYKDCLIILDGSTGKIILNPSQETYQHYVSKINLGAPDSLNTSEYNAETFDGYSVRLSANIDMDHELDLLHQYGGHGVGLFRSESIFISHQAIPDEEEQYLTYLNIISKMRNLPIIFRAFDIGGDKNLGYAHFSTEVNPFLGCRAIRFLLREKPIFKTQLRAILRAASSGNVSIMFPMISSLSELLESKMILKETQQELYDANIPYAKHVRVGCMIEVPSAAIIADLLAKECDFLSIGTNDLVQYALAVDRGNNSLSHFYTPTHPCILRLIKIVVTEANRYGIPVSVCGEIAADPIYTPLLLGLGVHELSVASRFLPLIKQKIRSISIVDASKLASQALSLSSPQDILRLLENFNP